MKKEIKKLRFRDVFKIEHDKSLTLKVDLMVKGEIFDIGENFGRDEKIAGVEFNIFKDFSLGVIESKGGGYEVVGFFVNPNNK